MKRGTACLCGWQHATISSRATQALQLREHVFWTCKGPLAIRRAIQHNLPSRGGAFAAASACVAARAWVYVPYLLFEGFSSTLVLWDGGGSCLCKRLCCGVIVQAVCERVLCVLG
jgi:hypothetical protein